MKKTWLKSYPPGCPEFVDINKYSSLVDMLEKSVHKFADQPAFINMGEVMTFRKLEERSRAFAAYLQNRMHVKKGDRVALMMPNLLQYPIALFGVLRAGAIVVNVNPLYTPRELEEQLNDAQVDTIVVAANFAHTLETVVSKTSIKNVILTELGDQFPRAKRTLVNFAVKYVKKVVPKFHLPNAVKMRAVLSKGRRLQYVKPYITPEDLSFIQYTGGTTGVAKGAMLTHQNVVANIMQARGMFAPMLDVGREMIVTALPLYHVFALTVNCLLLLEMGGQNLLITDPRDIKGFIKELKKYQFTALTGVNTLFNALVNDEDFHEVDMSNIKITVGGGMSVQKAVADKWKEVTGTHILEGYGLTECSPLVAANPYDITGFTGAIGVPAPSTEIRLIDDEGNVVADDQEQIGELQVRGPQVMKGYWNRPGVTKEVLTEDGWVSTGDIVRVDEKGYVFLIDRKKDMILVSGFNVYPNEVEDVVASHKKVLEVAAIGVPHEVSGEIVKLVVVKQDETLTKDELLKYCRKNLTGYKRPKIIEFKNELPKSNVGKILRRVIKEQDEAERATQEQREASIEQEEKTGKGL